MYPKIEKLIKKYFFDECLSIVLNGETDKDYSAELVIDMDGLEFKTSFIAYKEDIERWKSKK